MKKFCVFCGKHPEGKNKEHVIPKWLIERTGDPNRIARFGVDFRKNPPTWREFSFDSLTFPACAKCNGNFSKLEGHAKTVVESLLNHETLSQIELSILFDWLDKVRIGLWLGYFYLDSNPLEIRPHYHIAARMGQADRTVAIIRVKGSQPGINFVGPESPCFQGSPTCFALRINDFCLLNVSGISSCSRRLGFPYANPKYLRDDGQLEITVEVGSGRIMRPVQRDLAFPNAVLLHQPIFRTCFTDENTKKILDTEWARARSLNWEEGCGAVFLEKGNQVYKYPETATLDWLPDEAWTLEETYARIVPVVYERLIRDLRQGALISGRERRKFMLKGIAQFKRVHDALLRLVGLRSRKKRIKLIDAEN
jgi:hypothetical protein